ncbi:complex I NDUFA9 subunit family protein [Pedosphaera parvula]|uniref:NAD-dependent epimerase/dehydratase n=1 Tax=Pedosphaera parvula (strain Ellin514) TaxID=320771 RepID=B9XIA3_PEDPL|nr:complex I NDUFA9 subunit family protein [Pedosphaera parvula]EEF60364.1 NAD-dependent epimerase/dehydratase [Pedosphaera parvula Ellin514]
MKVLVTGASGFVGQEVLEKLHAAGHQSRILARHPTSMRTRTQASEFGAEVHAGDILDVASLARGLKGIDAVIHLVGIISELGESTFENIHIRGAENVVDAARIAGVRRFVHMSAMGTRANASSRYHKTKWAAEEYVRKSGLDYTIFRPSIIYGPKDLFVNLFAKISQLSPIMPVMGNGQSKLQPIPVSDVATCFVKALTEPASLGQTYELGGRDVLTLEQVIDEILLATNRRRLKVHIPLSIARSQASLLEFAYPRLLGKAPPLNHDQLIMLQEDNIGDSEPANKLFRLQPISFRQGISAYLKK